MDSSGMFVSDVLSGYLNAKPIDRGLWQRLGASYRINWPTLSDAIN
jgi:hypothetical protein